MTDPPATANPPAPPSSRRHWPIVAILVLIAVSSVVRSGTWLLIGLLLLAVFLIPPLVRLALYSVGARLRVLYLLTGVLPGLMVVLSAYYGAVLGQVATGVIERRIERWSLDVERHLARAQIGYWRARGTGADRLVAVIEAESPQREHFGEARFVKQLESSSGRSPGEILAGLLDALERWRGGVELNDDVTLVVVSIRR